MVLLPYVDFNAKCVGVVPDGTVQILNDSDALEFMAIKRQILQAKRLK